MTQQKLFPPEQKEPCNRCTNEGQNLIGCDWLCNECLQKDKPLNNWLEKNGFN